MELLSAGASPEHLAAGLLTPILFLVGRLMLRRLFSFRGQLGQIPYLGLTAGVLLAGQLYTARAAAGLASLDALPLPDDKKPLIRILMVVAATFAVPYLVMVLQVKRLRNIGPEPLVFAGGVLLLMLLACGYEATTVAGILSPASKADTLFLVLAYVPVALALAAWPRDGAGGWLRLPSLGQAPVGEAEDGDADEEPEPYVPASPMFADLVPAGYTPPARMAVAPVSDAADLPHLPTGRLIPGYTAPERRAQTALPPRAAPARAAPGAAPSFGRRAT